RPLRQGDHTGVDAVCTYRTQPSAPPLDRVGLYHEVSNKTSGITRLGPYSLDKDTLYTNGGHYFLVFPIFFLSAALPAGTGNFTVNFTVTNLQYSSSLRNPSSAEFSAAARALTALLDQLFKKTSIHPVYRGCKMMAFRPAQKDEGTRVDAVCTYERDSAASQFDRITLYHEMSNKTNSITSLGVYSLDQESLYINGYNKPLERPAPGIATTPRPASRNFTLNFTLTNLPYSADLETPSSRRFISTMKVINHYIDPLFKSSNISSAYTGCKVIRFRSVSNTGNTGVDAVCSYKNNIRFDREKVYHELSIMTKGITKLGHYSLEKNSLYINDITRKPVLTEAPAKLGYRLTFRIVNENLTNPDSQSPEYKAAVEHISNKMNQLYHQSNLRDQFLNCSITRLRAGSIVVDCNCFFQPDPSINRAVVETAFQDGTSNATGLWLGSSYRLKELSVDTIEAVTYKTPLKSGKENFRLSFRISNLPYSPELQDSSSQMYQVNKEKIEKELDVFQRSSLRDYFAGCTVESFGPVHGKTYINVVSTCKFTLDPSQTLQKQEVYEELTRLTHGFTKLGPSYELEEQSLVAEGYFPLKVDEQESKRPELQYWAILLICVFTLLGFILLLLLCFLIIFCLRRKSHLYQVQQGMYGVYFPHLNTR
ncbi:Mucin-16, partial [Buceros rhinoceros silvestris]